MSYQIPLVNGFHWLEYAPFFREDSASVDALTNASAEVYHSEQLIPAYAAATSLVLLILHAIVLSRPIQALRTRLRGGYDVPQHSEDGREEDGGERGIRGVTVRHIRLHGGWTIFMFKLARLAGCLVLLATATATLVINRLNERKSHFSSQDWIDEALCAFFLYTSLLALASVLTRGLTSKVAGTHSVLLLLVSWAIYAYRDLWPLATFTEVPKDIHEGWLLWLKVSLLTVTAVIIPLTIPRQYNPVDQLNPYPEPAPDQTSPIISMALHFFQEKTVWKAAKVSHLPYDELPPLGDSDEASNLRKRAFKNLDVFSGAPRRHIFFGLMKTFYKDYCVMTLMVILLVLSTFVSPIGTFKVLDYLETQGEGAVVRPWFWIMWLFLGPLCSSMSMQWYDFTTTRLLVRCEAVLTELLFEHSLRIRMKESTENGGGSAATSSTASRPASYIQNSENASSTTTLQDSADSTSQSSSPRKIKKFFGRFSRKAKSTESLKEVPKGETGNLVGKINNLASTDLGNIVDGRDFIFFVVYTPFQIALCITFLYYVLDWSAFVGLAAIIIMMPAPGLVARFVRNVQFTRLGKTDARVQYVTETMNVLRMVKLFGWESKMNKRIGEKRDDELTWVGWKMTTDLLIGIINYCVPMFTMIATFATYTMVMKQPLSVSKVFSTMSVFDLLKNQLHAALHIMSQVVTGKVSLDRLNEFVHKSELLDRYDEQGNSLTPSLKGPEDASQDIGFHRASFAWSNEGTSWLTPASSNNFHLSIDHELKFAKGVLNIIIGPTGSGKTSLLMALLGEMHFIPGGPNSWYNLPRVGGVAYAAQESWVQNETIRENIVFGSEFDERRYKKVIHQCGLERDLTLFEAGDATEVGEKGLTLSGGQKARITLARAVYSRAEILLLDDVLAALDVHTSKWIVDKCFKGDLMKGRTVILVTHNVALAANAASFAVWVQHGRVIAQGLPSEVIFNDGSSYQGSVDEKEEEDTANAEAENDEPAEEAGTAGKLIVAEEIQEGHISWAALKLYLGGLAGNHPVLFFVVWIGGIIASESTSTFQTWWIGHWGEQYQEHDRSDVDVGKYLGVYVLLMTTALAFYSLAYTTYVRGAMRACNTIHRRLVDSILGTTLRWLDTTPTSRVITRCTQDMRAIDGPIAYLCTSLAVYTITMIVKIISIMAITPVFIGPGLVVAIVGGICGRIYIKAQLSVKREMSNAKAPVLGHFGAAIAGLASIRAYGAEQRFKNISLDRINKYTRAARTFYNLNRWICIRIDTLGGLFAATLAAFLVYLPNSKADYAGFSLNMAVGFSAMILQWVKMLNEFEVQGNSLERVEQYTNVEQEPKPTVRGTPPAFWPASGRIQVENLSARYSGSGPKVLKDLSFTIESGQRIGVVGRTGSGKSSLTLSLLRCILTEGEVYYDGLPTSKINLDALRSNITIIPQVPELLSGTLRQNLDPFDQYDDATLNASLRAAGLFNLQNVDDEARITLDSAISSGGGNLSVGQRQILALSRAIVRGSKLLILDEATSAIDYQTDSVIQESLRKELDKDVTLITVAHRLQTIMDADKIMVLDAGNVVEFDSPSALLKIPNGRLRSLVDESADKSALYAMAEGKRSSTAL